jgi:hypothetical protein
MMAGTNSAIAKVPDRMLSQEWSRYFYTTPKTYAEVDGLIYLNAHNDEEAIALYERAGDALRCPPDRVMRSDHKALRATGLEAVREQVRHGSA